MGRRLLRALGAAGLLLVLLILALWSAFRPPVLQVPSQGRLVFSNVTVVNPGLERRAGQTLTVQGEQIESISAERLDSHEAEATSRFAGAYVLPGLIDMHVHHGVGPSDRQLFGLLFLAHGVTTVRDVGDPLGTMLEHRRRVREGKYPGPRVFACGPLVDGDPPWRSHARVVRNAAEAQSVVDELAQAGVDCLKVYWRLSRDALAGIRAAAARHRLPVIGHLPFGVPFEEAHLADVQHLTGVEGMANQAGLNEKAQLLEFTAALRAVDSARIDFIVRTSVEQGIAHTPTLIMLAQMARRADYPQPLADPAMRLLPRWYREVFWRPRAGLLQVWQEWGAMLPKLHEVVRRLHTAGVRIHAGSDTFESFLVPGVSLQQELHQLLHVGLATEEVWVAATRWAGEALKEPKLGTLQEGAPADFLILREDPTRDLTALATLEAVVAQGRLYPKEVLDAAIERHRRYFEGWLYDRVLMALARVLNVRGPDEPESDE